MDWQIVLATATNPAPTASWQVRVIQLVVGILIVAYGVQAIIFRRQNAQMFRPWVVYHPAVMVVMGVWASAIGLVFVVSAVAQLLPAGQHIH